MLAFQIQIQKKQNNTENCKKVLTVISQISSQPLDFEKKNSNMEKKKIIQRKKCVHWSEEEDIKFIYYLLENFKNFRKSGIDQRVIKNQFKKMASFMITRNSNQCRTHYNRMIREKSAVKNSLEYYLQGKLQQHKSSNQNYNKFVLRIALDVGQNTIPQQEFIKKISKIEENIRYILKFNQELKQRKIQAQESAQINSNLKKKEIIDSYTYPMDLNSQLIDEQSQIKLLSSQEDKIVPQLNYKQQQNQQFIHML